MFVRCNRQCCLCLKQCGVNIEAAHIIAEAEGGSNDAENGIPLCLDCHQEVGSYNDKHPRGNKIRPEELRARRDRVYELVAEGRLNILSPANLARLFDRRMELSSAKYCISNPTVAQLIVAIDHLDYRDWDNAFLILTDCAWENAFVQIYQERTLLFNVEFRDGATQRQYRAVKQISVEAVKLMLLAYLHGDDDSMKHAIEWKDITASVTRLA